MGKGQNINAHWSLSKLMQAPLYDFMLAGFRTSLVEVTADVAEIARELEVKPEDVSELLQSHSKTWTGEELPVMDKQREWLFEMESGYCEDSWNDNKGSDTLCDLRW